MIRSANAFKVDAVIILSQNKADIFHPNLIRASIGASFVTPIFCCQLEEFACFVKENKTRCLAAALTPESKSCIKSDLNTGPLVLCVGSEAWGLSPTLLALCQEKIIIPMQGQVDSLNVSVACGILLYESFRQI